MRNSLFACIVACIAIPSIAYAQEGRWKLGGDGSCYWDQYDGGPNQCEPPVEEVRGALSQTVALMNDVVVNSDCSSIEDEQERYSCGLLVAGAASAASIASAGTNIYADALASYCAAAEIFYGLQSVLESIHSWADARGQYWMAVSIVEYVRDITLPIIMALH